MGNKRVLIYEHILGGGLFARGPEKAAQLAPEGWAMLGAAIEDFAALPEVSVQYLWDRHVPGWQPPQSACVQPVWIGSPEESLQTLLHLARNADAVLLIAPEIGHVLAELVRRVESTGALLLGPPGSMVELASDKDQTATYLRGCGLPVPPGRVIPRGKTLPEDFPRPAVLKPLDGAGCLGIRLVDRPGWTPTPVEAPLRAEPLLPGLPASVAILSGGPQPVLCPPCRQHIRWNHSAHYEGGAYPLPEPLAERASRLAAAVAAALPQARGYWGVDLVLGPADDGSQDYVIELNPRLTTSYVALRRACRDSLAQAIWDAALGKQVSPRFDTLPRKFTPGGQVIEDSAS